MMIKSIFKKFASKSQAGDTIVEVLISISVLSVVLAGCYVVANRSLQTGIESAQRSEALSWAQQQIEYIKSASNNNPALLATYKNHSGITGGFCIVGSGGTAIYADNDLHHCQMGSGSQYKISTSYNDLVFTVVASWDSSLASQPIDQMTLYYKLPNTY